MMIIIRYSEIFLKGKNRINFERRLVDNIKFMLKANSSKAKPIIERNRILVDDDDATYLNEVFGVHSISMAKKLPLDIEVLKKEAFSIAKKHEKKFSTFKIDTKRLNKNNELNSIEIDRSVGEPIYEELHKKVSLGKPEFTIFIEIIDDAYMFTEKIPGPGGLPLGIEGKAFALIENKAGLDAAKKMMRRGVIIYPAFTRENKYASEIQKLSPGYTIKAFKIKKIDELDRIAKRHDAKALVVCDTIESIKEYETALPIFRPNISVLD